MGTEYLFFLLSLFFFPFLCFPLLPSLLPTFLYFWGQKSSFLGQWSSPPLPPGVCPDSCPLSQWCCLTISFSATCFSFCLQSFLTSSFPMSWLFSSGGQSIGASASATALPMNIQGWFPLWLTGLISLQSKGLSRVFRDSVLPLQVTQVWSLARELGSCMLWDIAKRS